MMRLFAQCRSTNSSTWACMPSACVLKFRDHGLLFPKLGSPIRKNKLSDCSAIAFTDEAFLKSFAAIFSMSTGVVECLCRQEPTTGHRSLLLPSCLRVSIRHFYPPQPGGLLLAVPSTHQLELHCVIGTGSLNGDQLAMRLFAQCAANISQCSRACCSTRRAPSLNCLLKKSRTSAMRASKRAGMSSCISTALCARWPLNSSRTVWHQGHIALFEGNCCPWATNWALFAATVSSALVTSARFAPISCCVRSAMFRSYSTS